MGELTWADIEDTLRVDEVLDDLGIPVVRETRTGWQNTSCPLPSHPGQDHSPSFGVNADRGRYRCFTCDAGGTIANLVMELEDVTYEEALDYLVKFSDADVDSDVAHMEQIARIHEKAEADWNVRKPRPNTIVLPYFLPDILDRLPYAPTSLLEPWGIEEPHVVKAFGLRYDEERERKYGEDYETYVGPALIIPHYCNDNLVGWQERWLDDDRPKAIPKYTNSSGFPREETLFNFDRAYTMSIELDEPTVVVESVMTVIRLHQLDVTAVASFGAALNLLQLKRLAALHESVLSFDNDDPGRKAQRKVTEFLLDRGSYVSALDFPKGAKADLADLPDAEILRLIDGRKTANGIY